MLRGTGRHCGLFDLTVPLAGPQLLLAATDQDQLAVRVRCTRRAVVPSYLDRRHACPSRRRISSWRGRGHRPRRGQTGGRRCRKIPRRCPRRRGRSRGAVQEGGDRHNEQNWQRVCTPSIDVDEPNPTTCVTTGLVARRPSDGCRHRRNNPTNVAARVDATRTDRFPEATEQCEAPTRMPDCVLTTGCSYNHRTQSVRSCAHRTGGRHGACS
jgi:hypothetical protein